MYDMRYLREYENLINLLNTTTSLSETIHRWQHFRRFYAMLMLCYELSIFTQNKNLQ